MDNCPKDWMCPALMSDARFITDYRPSGAVEWQVDFQNRLPNPHQARLWRQRRAAQMMRMDRAMARRYYACGSCRPYYAADPSGWDGYWKGVQGFLREQHKGRFYGSARAGYGGAK